MLIERTSKEIIIRFTALVDIHDLQGFLNYDPLQETTSKYKVDQLKQISLLRKLIRTGGLKTENAEALAAKVH